MDTLAGRYGVPPVGPPRDFHPLVVRPAGRTQKKNRKIYCNFLRFCNFQMVGMMRVELTTF